MSDEEREELTKLSEAVSLAQLRCQNHGYTNVANLSFEERGKVQAESDRLSAELREATGRRDALLSILDEKTAKASQAYYRQKFGIA